MLKERKIETCEAGWGRERVKTLHLMKGGTASLDLLQKEALSRKVLILMVLDVPLFHIAILTN